MKLVSSSCVFCREPITEDEPRRPNSKGEWAHLECEQRAYERDENMQGLFDEGYAKLAGRAPDPARRRKAPPKRG